MILTKRNTMITATTSRSYRACNFRIMISTCRSKSCTSRITNIKRRRNFVPYSSSLSTSSSSSTISDNPTSNRLSFSKASLGLEGKLILPVLEEVKQLPEVEKAWNFHEGANNNNDDDTLNFPSDTAVENLNRAVDVFSSFAAGGKEHLAVLAMLAECQQRLADYDATLRTLQEIENFSQSHLSSKNNVMEDIILAQAKVLWTKGEFDQCQALCESIISLYDDFSETFPTTNVQMATAMMGKAVSQLASMDTLDDAYSVRDYFRVAIKFLERHPTSGTSLPLVAAHLNAGIAEAIYANFLEETHEISIPMDGALRTWFRGLQIVNDEGKDPKGTTTFVEASLQANLGWGVLFFEQERSDYLSKASDYAKKSLSLYDSDPRLRSYQGMNRTLSIVASCYHLAGNAVTAEGLFQTAMSHVKNSNQHQHQHLRPDPFTLLAHRDACYMYMKLCSEWDKREGDVQRLRNEIEQIDATSLPINWRKKSAMYGSLWFWTPGDFL